MGAPWRWRTAASTTPVSSFPSSGCCSAACRRRRDELQLGIGGAECAETPPRKEPTGMLVSGSGLSGGSRRPARTLPQLPEYPRQLTHQASELLQGFRQPLGHRAQRRGHLLFQDR